MKMKLLKYPLILALVFLTASCRKDATPTEDLMEMEVTGATRTHTGLFVNGPYGSVSGTAHIVRNPGGSIQLVIEGLKSSNGPDLKVYLSKELQPVNFINLGSLKSVNGNQVYDVSGNPDIGSFKYALVHCQAFNHMFGSAELKKN